MLIEWALIAVLYGGIGVAAFIWVDWQMNIAGDPTAEKIKYAWFAGLFWPLWFFVLPLFVIFVMKRDPEWLKK